MAQHRLQNNSTALWYVGAWPEIKVPNSLRKTGDFEVSDCVMKGPEAARGV